MSAALPTKEERKAYACDAFAISSLRTADTEIDRLVDCYQHNPEDLVLLEALSTSVLVFYMRPFKGRPPFKLDNTIIPAEYQKLHKGFELQRDKVIAHRDANLQPAAWGSPNDCGFIFDGKTIMPRVYRCVLDQVKAVELKKLIRSLLAILEPRIGSFYQKHLNPTLTPGHYLISLEDSPAFWFSRAAE